MANKMGLQKSINDLPNIIKSESIPILFVDDTSIIITNPSHTDYENNFTQMPKNINEWFKGNLLTLNLDKTYFMQFSTKNSNIMNMHMHVHIIYAIWASKPYIPLQIIMIYFSYFHFISYGLIFWVNSPLIIHIYMQKR
jgi:hypothetical protein